MFKNIISTYKAFKKEKDKCCDDLSKFSDNLRSDMKDYLAKEEERSKINHHKKLLKLVKKYENMDELVTVEDVRLAKKKYLSGDISEDYVNTRPKQRKLMLQKEIDKLSSNPTTKELENILDVVKSLKGKV